MEHRLTLRRDINNANANRNFSTDSANGHFIREV